MVFAIHTSDSCNTLISLDNNVKSRSQNLCSSGCHCDDRHTNNISGFRRTALLLPADDFLADASDADGYYDCDCHDGAVVEQPLYLPTSSSESDDPVAVDKYLRNLPQIMEGCDELLSYEPRVLDETEKLVYVHQGELAHALPSQCDILVSDRATTCHILAFRSTYGTSEPMTSLTHLDGPTYEDCIREMVQEHKAHHSASVHEEEKKEDDARIEMDIHILGGFEDEDGTSRSMSNWLMNVLAGIAEEEAHAIKFVLRTCAITSMNDNGFCAPMGRGMGIHLESGKCFLAKVTNVEALGPAMTLRSARLWSNHSHKHSTLTLVHGTKSSELRVSPFRFAAFPGLEQLLRLPDHLMIQHTSTSPKVEEQDEFCTNVRSTLHFLKQVDCHQVFGPHCDRPLVYRRDAKSHQWTLVRQR